MLGSIGMPELIVIFLIALVIFGPRKLPELGRSLGKSIAEFKRASNELRSTLEEEIRLEERKPAPSTVAPPAPVTASADAALGSAQSGQSALSGQGQGDPSSVGRAADHHTA